MRIGGSGIWRAVAAMALLPAVGCSSQEPSEQPTTASISAGTAVSSEPELGRYAVESDRQSARTDPRQPLAIIHTSLGKITVRLDVKNAPRTVHNFVNYAESGHYDQSLFHYVEQGHLILGGAFAVDRTPRQPVATIRNEAHNGLENKRGTIAMSREYDSIDSATCQFFINLADNPALDHQDMTPEGYGYCVFGNVIDGLEVTDQIGNVPVEDSDDWSNSPVTPVIIESIELVWSSDAAPRHDSSLNARSTGLP